MIVIRKAAFAALLAAFASACSSGAQPTGPLNDFEFQRLFEAARSPNDAFQEDRNLTIVLARTDLTMDQRLKTLNLRATGRSSAAEDKNGAITDYEEFLRIAPSDYPTAPRVREDLDYVKQQKRLIEDRLEGRARSDNNQRFQDLLTLGRHDEAAAFVRQSGLTPSSIYVEKLTRLGYLCEGPAYSGSSYQWGSSSAGYHVVFWCDTRSPNVR